MGRPGISKDDVYSAAQTLAERGVVPTMHAVHAHLGSGSLTTIHKHLLLWKKERLLKPAILSYQFISAEQARNKLKQEVSVLLSELTNLKAENAKLLRLMAEIKSQHNEIVSLLLLDKNSEIENLKQELSAVHKASLDLVRSTSFTSHDILINERIKNINLHEKIKLLTENIKHFAKAVMPEMGE